MLCTSTVHNESQSPPPRRNSPRGPAGHSPPNSSLLSFVVPAALQAPGRKPVKPMAVDPPGPVPNPPHPEREPLKRQSRGIFGGFSLNLGGRLWLFMYFAPRTPGPSGEGSVLQRLNHLH